jgi:hypothetical protein
MECHREGVVESVSWWCVIERVSSLRECGMFINKTLYVPNFINPWHRTNSWHLVTTVPNVHYGTLKTFRRNCEIHLDTQATKIITTKKEKEKCFTWNGTVKMRHTTNSFYIDVFDCEKWWRIPTIQYTQNRGRFLGALWRHDRQTRTWRPLRLSYTNSSGGLRHVQSVTRFFDKLALEFPWEGRTHTGPEPYRRWCGWMCVEKNILNKKNDNGKSDAGTWSSSRGNHKRTWTSSRSESSLMVWLVSAIPKHSTSRKMGQGMLTRPTTDTIWNFFLPSEVSVHFW